MLRVFMRVQLACESMGNFDPAHSHSSGDERGERDRANIFAVSPLPPLLPTQTQTYLHTTYLFGGPLPQRVERGGEGTVKKSQLQLGKATAEEEEEVETGKTAGE